VRVAIPLAVLFACVVPTGARAAQENAPLAEAWRLAYGVDPVAPPAGPLPRSRELEGAIEAGRSAIGSSADPGPARSSWHG
jgi:hypothetical protein